MNPLRNSNTTDLRIWISILCLILPVAGSGCGTTKSRNATEQILVSDAVDRAIQDIDFRSLSGRTVYFDTTYIGTIKGIGFVNADYIVSGLRQQLMAARCLLQESPDDAEIIIEARVGALGTNNHAMTIGIPQSNTLSTAASILPNAPPIPTIPEIALARSDMEDGAAKIGVFAYYRETKMPVWQSGTMLARSSARDTWIMGAGPFQRGTIYQGTQFAGSEVKLAGLLRKEEEGMQPAVPYSKEHLFVDPREERLLAPEVRLAGHEESASEDDEDSSASEKEKKDPKYRVTAEETKSKKSSSADAAEKP